MKGIGHTEGFYRYCRKCGEKYFEPLIKKPIEDAQRFNLGQCVTCYHLEKKDHSAEIIANHFPEDESWVDRAAEEIVERWKYDFPSPTAAKIIIREIINGCMRG